MKHKLAIVGSWDAVAGFALLGVDVVPVNSPAEAVEELHRLKKEMEKDEQGVERNVYAIVFITEDLASGISPDDEKKLARGALPAIIPLPSHKGSTGLPAEAPKGAQASYGMQRLSRIVERAVGTDILK